MNRSFGSGTDVFKAFDGITMGIPSQGKAKEDWTKIDRT